MEINIPPNSSLIIYLFGSHARSQPNSDSDIDLLLLTNKEESSETDSFFELNNTLDPNGVSIYSIKKIKDYFQEGNLFAWHLFLESKLIFGDDILRKLDSPEKYTNFKNDSLGIIELVNSVIEELKLNTQFTSINYEAGLLYVSIRNFSQFFSAYFLNIYNFNRDIPFQLNEYTPDDIHPDEYKILMQARFCSTRGSSPLTIDHQWLLLKGQQTLSWMQKLSRITNEVQ